METARGKQEEEADTRIIVRNTEKKEHGHEGETSQTSANWS